MGSSLYAAIQGGGGSETFEFGRKTKTGWNNYRVTIENRTSPDMQQAAREMGRAQVALGSDPMDANGLKSADIWFKSLWNLHFKPTRLEKRVKNKWVKVTNKQEAILEPYELKNGTYKKLADMNTAFYGRDYTTKRKWSLAQIKEKSNAVWDLEANQNNTLLTKVGRLLNKSVVFNLTP